MTFLPFELVYSVSRNISVKEYHRLRQTCTMLSRLDTVKYLDFPSYKEEVNFHALKLRENRRISLNNKRINDESFIFIAVNGHSHEFIRLFHTKALNEISINAKQFAFIALLRQHLFPQEMICELLKNGCVDPTVINNIGNNCLHISAREGYDKVVKLLLDDPRMDPSLCNSFGQNCLHLQSICDGGIALFKLIFEEGRVYPSVVDNNGNNCLYLSVRSGHIEIFMMLRSEA
jgi:hypothetical protein